MLQVVAYKRYKTKGNYFKNRQPENVVAVDYKR